MSLTGCNHRPHPTQSKQSLISMKYCILHPNCHHLIYHSCMFHVLQSNFKSPPPPIHVSSFLPIPHSSKYLSSTLAMLLSPQHLCFTVISHTAQCLKSNVFVANRLQQQKSTRINDPFHNSAPHTHASSSRWIPKHPTGSIVPNSPQFYKI